MSFCVRMHTNTVESYWGRKSKTLCGANTQCQFPLVIWHSLFQVGGSFVKTLQASLVLVNTLSFKLPGFLQRVWYVCNAWKVNRRSSGILTFILQRASQAISSRKPSRTPFVLQCQNGVIRVSDPDYEKGSQSSPLQIREVSWFCCLQMRIWDVHRSRHRFLNMDLRHKNSMVGLIAFRPLLVMCGNHLKAGLSPPEVLLTTGPLLATTGDRGRKFLPGWHPERIVLNQKPHGSEIMPHLRCAGGGR